MPHNASRSLTVHWKVAIRGPHNGDMPTGRFQIWTYTSNTRIYMTVDNVWEGVAKIIEQKRRYPPVPKGPKVQIVDLGPPANWTRCPICWLKKPPDWSICSLCRKEREAAA